MSFKEIRTKFGKAIKLTTSLQGRDLLRVSEINKGIAFNEQERDTFALTGLLPKHVANIEEQLQRSYEKFTAAQGAIAKHLYLIELKKENEVLFYRLAAKYLEEILPIIYTPTIGDAVEQYSHQFGSSEGLFFSYPDRHKFKDILKVYDPNDIDLVIITDGEGVLGIGDWGVGGIDICIGKLMVYTACGGINPNRCLPVQLDVGTNNQKLLDDPMYLGWKEKRLPTGPEYDEFIELAVQAISEHFPNVYLHWEDFGRINARRNLQRYKDKMCTFNDDIQGTGATAAATLLSALVASKQSIKDQRVVVLGAGSAGVGVSDQILNTMILSGMKKEEALANFWLIDIDGLLTQDMKLLDYQKQYARDPKEAKNFARNSKGKITLKEVVEVVKPTILIGCSTVKGAFSEDIIKNMSQHCKDPIVFPLSNPTSLSEATPEDIMQWTKGSALIATGSPFAPVHYEGKTYEIAQCNNALVFPGIGLGIIASQATRVTNAMIAKACEALSSHSPARNDRTEPLLPRFSKVKEVARSIALAVALQACDDGVARRKDKNTLQNYIEGNFWSPQYLPITKED